MRKVMGGGMRQAGFLAAAGIYALDNQVARLKEDNDNAKRLGAALAARTYVAGVRPVQSNIVIFDVYPPYTAASFIEKLQSLGINSSAFGPMTVRFVTHLDVSAEMIDQTIAILEDLD
jgi:threonine aldolase